MSPAFSTWTMRNVLFALACAPALCAGQSITWSWPNTPCAVLLNCDTGCTACNLPVNTDAAFIGNNLGRQGVDICPQSAVPGDNVLLTYGWPTVPDDSHSLFLTGIAFTPMRIDSIVLRHRSGPDGPQRLLINYGINGADPLAAISDGFTPGSFAETVITDLGCLEAGEGMVYALFELKFQAYQGAGGSWDLDQVRVVATPCTQTGVEELHDVPAGTFNQRFDVLGRPVGTNVAPGVYGDRRRWIAIQ